MASYLLVPLSCCGSFCIIICLEDRIFTESALYAEHGVLQRSFLPLGFLICKKVCLFLLLGYHRVCRHIYSPDHQGRVCNLVKYIKYSFGYLVQGCSMASKVHQGVVCPWSRSADLVI